MPISSQVSDMLPHYHDTLMLLKKYRDIAWIVEVSSRNLQEEFRAEYGCPGRDVLNSLALNKTDASLMDCSQSLEHSAKMLHIIDSAVDLIREKHKKGELYYWILYYAYLSPHKYENSSEILRALESKAPPISLRTYYARREEAIELLSSVLWGYMPFWRFQRCTHSCRVVATTFSIGRASVPAPMLSSWRVVSPRCHALATVTCP